MGGQGGQRLPQNTYSTLRQLCKLSYRVVRSAGIGTSCSGPREQRQEEPNTRRSAQPHDDYESPETKSCTLGLILHRYVDHRFSPCTSIMAPSQYSSLGHMRSAHLFVVIHREAEARELNRHWIQRHKQPLHKQKCTTSLRHGQKEALDAARLLLHDTE